MIKVSVMYPNTPGAPATYIGMSHIYCDSVESFQAGFGPNAEEFMADIPNYIDLSPVILRFSEKCARELLIPRSGSVGIAYFSTRSQARVLSLHPK